MTEQSLSLSLVTGRDAVIDPYWLHMEIKKDPLQDGMSVAEAAKLIDAAYNIKACEPAETQQHDIWQQGSTGSDRNIWTDGKETIEEAAATIDAQRRFAAALSDYTTRCGATDISELIAYDLTVKVFRSHQDELYKLQMANGMAGSPVKRSARVVHTVDIKGQSSHTFDNPIITGPGIKAPVLIWQGFAGPAIHIMGNTAYWDGDVEATLRAEFNTEWDEVKIHVTGEYSDSSMISGTDLSVFGTGWYSGSESGEEIDDYQNIECSMLAFYHYEYEELTLNRPEDDGSTTETDKLNICNFVTSSGDGEREAGEPDPDAMCQQHVNETVVCQCDGKEESNSHYEPVPCPAGVLDGATLQGTQERRTYKDCGYRDEANDPAVYEGKCCTEWPFDHAMPLCKKVVTKFTGASEKDFNESDYPEGTRFVTVAPADGQCGEHITEQIIHAAQCCDEVSPIVWDYGNSAEVIADGSSGVVSITGGTGINTWKVRGDGFYTNPEHTQRDVTAGNSITIYTKDACGSATIYVTDGCSSESGNVKSPKGRWVTVPDGECGMPVDLAENFVLLSTYTAYGTSGNHRTLETYSGSSIHDFVYGSSEDPYMNPDIMCGFVGTGGIEPCLTPIQKTCPETYFYLVDLPGGFSIDLGGGKWEVLQFISQKMPYDLIFQEWIC